MHAALPRHAPVRGPVRRPAAVSWRPGLALLVALTLSGCLSRYRAPGPGEASALVKVRLAYDHARALALIPPDAQLPQASIQLLAGEARQTTELASQVLWDQLASAQPAPLETVTARVHAGRPLVLRVTFSVGWSVTRGEWVTRTEHTWKPVTRTVSKQVPRTESVYNSSTRQSEFRTSYVTEWVTETTNESVTETRRVWEQVTRPGGVSCTASVPLLPAEGAVYLIDYANLAVAENCSAVAFRQVAGPGGTFALLPP